MKNMRTLQKRIAYQLQQGSLDAEVTGITCDSRKVQPQNVFVCIRGNRMDWHVYAEEAVERGAAVLVAERELEGIPEKVTVLVVKDSREALAQLSCAWEDDPAQHLVTIGVTGTKGKTTTTYMIKAILEAAGQKTGLIGTNGAVIGENHYPTKNTTPESYILQEYFAKMVEAGCRYIVMEVSSQSYLMHRVDGLFFDYGIFLNISNDHIGPNEHASFEEYLYYKKQLLKNCRTALVNRDDPHFDAIVEGATAEILTFSLEQAADFTADDIHYVREHDFVGVEFQTHGRYEHDLRVGIPGKFNVDNALAAAGVCSFFDLPKEKVCHALEHIQVDGRMEIVYKSAKCTVIVDYAHNAVSMESLLLTLRDYKPKRLVCVFGCGGNRARDRRYSMGEIGGKLADLSIITADNSRFEKVEDILADIKVGLAKTDGKYVEIPDRREAIEYSLSHAEDGDIIAIIGKGHEDYQEIRGVKYHFDEREAVAEILEEIKEGKRVRTV